jgi:hypothetical protein
MGEVPMKPLKRDLRLIVNEKFAELGMNGSHHVFREYKALLFSHQLERFFISDIDWFKGAAELLELVDQLHTQLTSLEDFIKLAERLNMEVPASIDKMKLAEWVKSNPNWKVKAFELEVQRRLNQSTLPKTKPTL